jgi:deoxyadenosine/deoxycytidine kinase
VAFLISQGIPAIGIEESFNEDLMALFYKFLKLGGKNPYSFTVQMDMLSRRMRAYDRAMLYTGKFRGMDKGSCPEITGPGGYVIVADGDLDTDALFAAKQMHDNNFSPEECKVYISTATQAPRYPIEHIIQLYVPPAVARERVMKRGRPFEKDMEESYLASLDRVYAGYSHEQLTAGRACLTVLDYSDRLSAEHILNQALQTPDAATLRAMYRQHRGIPEHDRTGPWGEEETGEGLCQFYSKCVLSSTQEAR